MCSNALVLAAHHLPNGKCSSTPRRCSICMFSFKILLRALYFCGIGSPNMESLEEKFKRGGKKMCALGGGGGAQQLKAGSLGLTLHSSKAPHVAGNKCLAQVNPEMNLLKHDSLPISYSTVLTSSAPLLPEVNVSMLCHQRHS